MQPLLFTAVACAPPRVVHTVNNFCVSGIFQSACWYKSIIRPRGAASSCLSHHLSPRHGVLLVPRVPVSKIVHVRSRVHRCPFGGHADVPQGAGRGRGGRRRGKMLPFRSTGPVLHNLLVFGPLVLEPYLHLKIKGKERKGVKKGHIPTQIPARYAGS